MWLCTIVTLALKAVESCSKALMTQQVFWSVLKKNFLVGDAGFL